MNINYINIKKTNRESDFLFINLCINIKILNSSFETHL